MFSTIIPELMTITVFILSLLCILAGRSPGYLQNYAVLGMNITSMKSNYYANTSEILPIHDFYNLHLTTHCQGYYHDGFNPPLVNVTCSPVSSYSKFLPSTLIRNDLLHAHSNATIESLSFPSEIESAFVSTYNLQLHVSYIFSIISLVWTGIAMLCGLLGFVVGQLGSFTSLFTTSASTCLLIACAILTAVQSQGAGTINFYGMDDGVEKGVGVVAGYGSGLLTMAWTAFGLSFVSTGVWVLAGLASAVYRST